MQRQTTLINQLFSSSITFNTICSFLAKHRSCIWWVQLNFLSKRESGPGCFLALCNGYQQISHRLATWLTCSLIPPADTAELINSTTTSSSPAKCTISWGHHSSWLYTFNLSLARDHSTWPFAISIFSNMIPPVTNRHHFHELELRGTHIPRIVAI